MRQVVTISAVLFIAAFIAGCSSIIGLKEPSLEEGEEPMDAMPDMSTNACPANCEYGCKEPGVCREGKLWVFLSTGAFSGMGLNGPTMARTFTDQACRTTADTLYARHGCAPARTHAILEVSVSDAIGGMKATYGIPANLEVLRAEDEVTITSSWDVLIGGTGVTSPATNTSTDPNDLSVGFWTGLGNLNCTNWSTASGDGRRGSASAVASNWLNRGATPCGDSRRLLCVCWAGGQ